MTPKSKAKELYKLYEFVYIQNYTSKHEVKQCAILAVDEILSILEMLNKPEYTAFLAKDKFDIGETEYETHLHGYEMKEYFEQVKNELEKITTQTE